MPPRATPTFTQGRYPERPIRVIVPRSAGGGVDSSRVNGPKGFGRCSAPSSSRIRAAGGTIGTITAAHAPGDGYTLLLGSTSDLVLNPAIMTHLQYDPLKDFAAITIMAISVASIMVHPSVPARTLKELVTYAKANPGKVSYGSAGVGTIRS